MDINMVEKQLFSIFRMFLISLCMRCIIIVVFVWRASLLRSLTNQHIRTLVYSNILAIALSSIYLVYMVYAFWFLLLMHVIFLGIIRKFLFLWCISYFQLDFFYFYMTYDFLHNKWMPCLLNVVSLLSDTQM